MRCFFGMERELPEWCPAVVWKIVIGFLDCSFSFYAIAACQQAEDFRLALLNAPFITEPSTRVHVHKRAHIGKYAVKLDFARALFGAWRHEHAVKFTWHDHDCFVELTSPTPATRDEINQSLAHLQSFIFGWQTALRVDWRCEAGVWIKECLEAERVFWSWRNLLPATQFQCHLKNCHNALPQKTQVVIRQKKRR